MPPACRTGGSGARSRGLAGRGVLRRVAGEALQCAGQDVYVIGAANSAGQAVLNFARHAKRVVMLVRGAGLEATMSEYLIRRIERAENVEVRLRTEVVAAHGSPPGAPDPGRPRGRNGGRRDGLALRVHRRLAAHRLRWAIRSSATRRGSSSPAGTCTRPKAAPRTARRSRWRQRVRVFAAGDVRLDSMKRVASAVGEGAMAVYLVHRYLATT